MGAEHYPVKFALSGILMLVVTCCGIFAEMYLSSKRHLRAFMEADLDLLESLNQLLASLSLGLGKQPFHCPNAFHCKDKSLN